MNELVTMVVKVPPYIKQHYIDEAKGLGQSTTPYTSLILTQRAIANGAVDNVPTEVNKEIETATMPFEIPEAIAVPAKTLWNEHGERIDALGNVIEY